MSLANQVTTRLVSTVTPQQNPGNVNTSPEIDVSGERGIEDSRQQRRARQGGGQILLQRAM
jgi:hypothetical protein